MKIKLAITLLLTVILLVGCTGEMDINREAEFQALIRQINEANVFLAIANDNLSLKERELLKLPEEWEVYRLKIDENTKFIDEKGTTISIDTALEHYHEFKIWTKEQFKPKWSNYLGLEELDHYPLYTATKIQLVHLKDEEYLARYYSGIEGRLNIFVYFGTIDEETKSDISREIMEKIHLSEFDFLLSVGFYNGKASERKETLLKIDGYPVYLVYNHESLLLKVYDKDELFKCIDYISID